MCLVTKSQSQHHPYYMLHATESIVHHGRCDYHSHDKETSDRRLNDRSHGHEHDLEIANSFGDGHKYGGRCVVAAATAEEEDVTAILMMGSRRVPLAIR